MRFSNWGALVQTPAMTARTR